MWKLIRPFIRKLYRIFTGLKYFIYDYVRFIKYGGYKNNFTDDLLRNYNMAMVYHGLEKSLSYKDRNPNSGWRNVYQILDLLVYAKANNNFGYHDIASIQVINKFIALPENKNDERIMEIKERLANYKQYDSAESHGSINYSYQDYKKGIMEDPEAFFYSRYSLREFKDEIVEEKEIKRAVKLAMKTPSVCNRQAWGIYHSSEKNVKEIVLNYQQGNKPFGKQIPNLIVITTDLKAFFSADEHYQHWIDGGLLSMSLMYAFHSIGIATCALNWSAKPKNDIELRKKLNIKENHTIIMILAVGYPDIANKVCASTRRPIDEVYFQLEERK